MAIIALNAARAENVTAVPTGWVVESYGATAVVLWYTPASCANGQILMPNGSTVAEHNRLFATVMAGKASGIKVFVNYTVTSGICVISSFGFAPN